MSFARIFGSALSGAFFANAVPHTVRGVTGQPFPTPFADPPGVGLSSPATNVGWGVTNLVFGALLHRRHAGTADRVAFFVGAAVVLLSLAELFGSNPRIAPKRRHR